MLNTNLVFSLYFNTITERINTLHTKQLNEAAELIWKAHASGGKTIIIGNGGSAAIASHLSLDLTKAVKILAINFNEADLLTYFTNCYGYENRVARALEAYAQQAVKVLIASTLPTCKWSSKVSSAVSQGVVTGIEGQAVVHKASISNNISIQLN